MNSKLQELFVRRLGEEMKAQSLSTHAVERIAKKLGHEIGKSSAHRILVGKQDPTLQMIETLAEVLGMPAWALLMEPGQIEQRIIRPIRPLRQNVVRLREPSPSVFRKHDATPQKTRAVDKRK